MMENKIKRIQSAAFEVRRHLGKGYLESVYQNALLLELANIGFYVQKEALIPVYYKDTQVGDFRADILVDNEIILELKAVESIHPAHEAQLINYLTATGLDYGVLINYGGEKFQFRVKTRLYNALS